MRVSSSAIHCGRAADLLGALGIGGDALDAQELVELREVLGFVLAQVGDGGIGGRGGIGSWLVMRPMIGGVTRQPDPATSHVQPVQPMRPTSVSPR